MDCGYLSWGLSWEFDYEIMERLENIVYMEAAFSKPKAWKNLEVIKAAREESEKC